MPKAAYLAAALALAVTAAHAADPPPSAVYDAPGIEAAQLVRRALVCIPQTFTPEASDDLPTEVVNSEPESGVAVANVGFRFSAGFWGGGAQRARSTLTFEARPGRFKVTHSAVRWTGLAGPTVHSFATVLSGPLVAGPEPTPNWTPLELNAVGSGKARETLAKLDDDLATCIRSSRAADAW
jgi:hypothetical protein